MNKYMNEKGRGPASWWQEKEEDTQSRSREGPQAINGRAQCSPTPSARAPGSLGTQQDLCGSHEAPFFILMCGLSPVHPPRKESRGVKSQSPTGSPKPALLTPRPCPAPRSQHGTDHARPVNTLGSTRPEGEQMRGRPSLLPLVDTGHIFPTLNALTPLKDGAP